MEISDEVFARVKRRRRGAVEALYARVYPPALRMARGLSGREDVAEGVVRFVMVRAMRVADKWREATGAERWFLHHTVLTARRAKHGPKAREDLLARGGDAGWVAFVRAVRGLPRQQMEAVVLHYGEHLNDRYLGVAMDCSAEAARAHLEAGRGALAGLAPGGWEAAVARLAVAYQALGPAEGEVGPAVGKWAAKALRPWRWRRMVKVVLVLALVVGGIVVWWKWW